MGRSPVRSEADAPPHHPGTRENTRRVGALQSAQMSRTKLDRLPFEERFPKLKRWIVACSACGRRGRDESLDLERSGIPGYGGWIKDEFPRHFDVLVLDADGLCAE